MRKIIKKLRKFNSRRNWEQYHSPKNLVMALSVEVSELMEIMQWKTQDETRTMTTVYDSLAVQVRHEIADIFIYAILLADFYNLDIREIINEKININAEKYPA